MVFGPRRHRCNDLRVSLDQWLAFGGISVSVIGLVVAVIAGLRVRDLAELQRRAVVPFQRTAARIRPLVERLSGRGTPGSTAATEPVATVQPSVDGPTDSVDDRPTRPVARVTSAVARDRSTKAAPRDEIDDELVSSTVIGGITLWIAGVVGLEFAAREVQVLRWIALLAIVASVGACVLIVFDISRHRARHLGWFVDLFVVDALIALSPTWLARPWFSQGRFDDLVDGLPSGGSVNDRLDNAVKDYGPGLIAHVLVQALGIAFLIAIALYVGITILRRARGRYGRRPRDRWISVTVLVVIAVTAMCATGSAVSVPTRTFTASTFTTGPAGHTIGADAPPLALRADRAGRVSLLIALCGDERILELSIGTRVVARDVASRGGGVIAIRVPAAAPSVPVRVVLTSTRRYETTATFLTRPRAGRFLPLRTRDTLASLLKRGHGC